MMPDGWTLKAFHEFSLDELYSVLQARSRVFVVEQDCAYLDLDDADQQALHLSYWENNQLLGYLRILPAGATFEECSIGRVLTSETARARGLGKQIMRRAIDECRKRFPTQRLRIGAQNYLRAFYESLGFVADSDVYDEDGIPHVEMVLQL